VFDVHGKKVRSVPYPGLGSGSLSGEWGKDEAWLFFGSFHVPETIYRYEMADGTKKIFDRRKAPIDSWKFERKQVCFSSKDGTKVPMFVVQPKGLKLEGKAPTLLTGYGGFDVSSTPYFDPQAAIWVENGGVYALANLRGGGEFGEEWHKAGMLDRKQNVFDDFIAAGEWLISNRYTSPGKLAISGVSNGDLLVGAALTQRPDLFGAVVCGYPLLDMVRYHQFSIAKLWVPEYGSSKDPEQFTTPRRATREENPSSSRSRT
jgi:prolyl oligopeptidase